MQRVTWKDIIKMWLHREGMATPHRPCKHTATPASTHTHTASTIGLNLHIAHTCFWFLAARHSLLSLSLAQEAQQAGQRRSLASACRGSQRARISRASLDKTREVTLASKKQQCFALHQSQKLLGQTVNSCHITRWIVGSSEAECTKTKVQIWGMLVLEVDGNIWVFKSPLFPKPHGSTKSSYFSSVCLTHAIYQFVHSVTYKWSLQF